MRSIEPIFICMFLPFPVEFKDIQSEEDAVIVIFVHFPYLYHRKVNEVMHIIAPNIIYIFLIMDLDVEIDNFPLEGKLR